MRPVAPILSTGVLCAGVLGRIIIAASPACELRRLDGLTVDASELIAYGRPTVLTGLLDSWPALLAWQTIDRFDALHGNASGFARDHDQLELRDVDVTVADYLSGSGLVNISSSAAFFVNDYHDSDLLDRIQSDYSTPAPLQNIGAVRVVSLERPRAGVAFHHHGEAWQATILGQKSWFLLAPSVKHVPLNYPCDFEDIEPPPLAERCTIRAGEVMYVPARWWHATCSLPPEPSLSVGATGSLAGWPPALLAARRGDVEGVLAAMSVADAQELRVRPDIFVGGERPLYIAAAFGHAATVAALLARSDVNPDASRLDGRTALHEAARRGSLQLVKLLHLAGADPTLADRSGSTALHHTCGERGFPSIAEYLMKHGSSANLPRRDGRTALHIACHGHRNPVRLLRVLLDNGAAPSPRDKDSCTPLMCCAAAGHAQGVGLLLRFGGAAAAREALDSNAHDALDHAVAGRGDAGVISRLLSAGLKAEGKLRAAVRLGELAPLRLLVNAGASTSGAMVEAARTGHVKVIGALLNDFGAVLDEREPDGGATSLHLAALGGHLSVVRALLLSGLNVTERDDDGLSAMHYATLAQGAVSPSRQRLVMEALAEAGGQDVWQLVDQRKATPLHFAAASGDIELVRWLVWDRAVADPHVLDARGATPADVAEESKHTEVSALLRSWRRDVAVQNEEL